MGGFCNDDGDYPGAAKQYSYVLKQDPGNFDALQGLTYAALGDGIDLAEARHALQQGLHIMAIRASTFLLPVWMQGRKAIQMRSRSLPRQQTRRG